MKRAARKHRLRARADVRGNFVRGFVATGLLAALQEGGGASRAVDARATLRQALRGGAALAAGSSAADALRRDDYSRALLAVAGGAAGIVAIDYLTRAAARPDKGGKQSGKEEA